MQFSKRAAIALLGGVSIAGIAGASAATLGTLSSTSLGSGDSVVAARGGQGGRGNARFLSNSRRAPSFAEQGEFGEEHWMRLEVKLLADAALIGFPNSGKSTLIRVLCGLLRHQQGHVTFDGREIDDWLTRSPQELRRPAKSQKYELTHRDGNGEIFFGAKLEYADMQTCITYRHAPGLWKSAVPKFDAKALPRSAQRLARSSRCCFTGAQA